MPSRLPAAVALLLALAMGGLPSCSGGREDPEASGGERIVVSIPPLAWAVRALAPEDARITVLLPAGTTPHAFELTPSDTAAIAKADLVVMAGAGLEPFLTSALRAHPSETRRTIRFADIVPEADRRALASDHHDHDHNHAHGPTDPHFWLDPVLMEAFIDHLGEALDAPQRAASLAKTCRAIDAEYTDALSDVATDTLIVQHDAYGYLTQRYGLEVVGTLRPVESVEPTPGDIARASRLIEEHALGAIFVEPQMPAGAAELLSRKTGARILTLDPLGDGNWPDLMRDNLNALVEGLRRRPADD